MRAGQREATGRRDRRRLCALDTAHRSNPTTGSVPTPRFERHELTAFNPHRHECSILARCCSRRDDRTCRSNHFGRRRAAHSPNTDEWMRRRASASIDHARRDDHRPHAAADSWPVGHQPSPGRVRYRTCVSGGRRFSDARLQPPSRGCSFSDRSAGCVRVEYGRREDRPTRVAPHARRVGADKQNEAARRTVGMMSA